MYNDVLVPVSFEVGRDARDALGIAQAIREGSGKITILHVLEHLPDYAREILPDSHVGDARKVVTEKLEPLTDGIENIGIVVVEGHSARAILDFSEKHQKDCIVITSHRPGMQDLFLGSTAAKVVRHAQCAVHVIR